MLELQRTDERCKTAFAKNVALLMEERQVNIGDLANLALIPQSKFFAAFNELDLLNVAQAARVADVLSVRVDDLINPDFKTESHRARDAALAVRTLLMKDTN